MESPYPEQVGNEGPDGLLVGKLDEQVLKIAKARNRMRRQYLPQRQHGFAIDRLRRKAWQIELVGALPLRDPQLAHSRGKGHVIGHIVLRG